MIFVVLAIYKLLNIGCLFLYLTGKPCPTCYMTHALYSLLKGDFSAYIHYNAMALPVAFVFICEIYNIGKKNIPLHICSSVILTVNLGYYIFRFIIH